CGPPRGLTEAAVRRHHELLWLDEFEHPSNAICNEFRGFDEVILHVHQSGRDRLARRRDIRKKLDLRHFPVRKFHREFIHSCIENMRKERPIRTMRHRPAYKVAEAEMRSDPGIDTVDRAIE